MPLRPRRIAPTLIALLAACSSDAGPAPEPKPKPPPELPATVEELTSGVRQYAIEAGGRALATDEAVPGKSGVYQVTMPTGSWLQLGAAANERYPNRDLRLVSDLGAFLDGYSLATEERSPEDLAIERLESFGQDCDSVAIDPDALDGAAEAYAIQCCAPHPSGGLLCVYSLAAACRERVVVAGAVGSASPHIAELEKILVSLRCTAE